MKFRVGSIVWLAFSRDELTMGFAFPKEERDAFIQANPETFFLPRQGELRYNWIESRLPLIEPDALEALLIDAWAMVVPKMVSRAFR